LRFRAIRAGSASTFLNPGETSGKRSHSAAAATAGPLATAAATVIDAAANAGFGARLLARWCAETLDSAVEDESAIFDLLASARWDRVRGRWWGGSDRSLHCREAYGGVRDEGAAAVLYVLSGLGQLSWELNPLMSLTRGPSHVLAHTWPTYQWQRQSAIQYTYVGQCSSLARCGHAIGPVLWDADRVGIYPFNLELKFVTGISPSYLIQIWWLFFMNFSKITLLSSMTFLITHSIS